MIEPLKCPARPRLKPNGSDGMDLLMIGRWPQLGPTIIAQFSFQTSGIIAADVLLALRIGIVALEGMFSAKVLFEDASVKFGLVDHE